MRADDWSVSKLFRKGAAPTMNVRTVGPLSLVPAKDQEKDVDVESFVETYEEPAMSHLKLFALRLALLLSAITVSLYALPFTFRGLGALVNNVQSYKEDSCPQASALSPSKHSSLLDSLEDDFATTEFQSKAIESLGGAVRIP